MQLPPRYRVLHHIATGGMAAVYAARDELLGRDVAVKVLAEPFAADDDARRRFTREARAAARVGHHPNVVTIFDIAEWEGSAFIVMELLEGGTVRDRLREGGAIPHALALRWLEQTAAALDAAHLAGMVHRDVKPANLLFDDHGILKVADFGIATLGDDLSLTRTGQVIGTAAYLSPEQAAGRTATAASDRYALAVVAFELLTGRRPFAVEGPQVAQAMAHMDSEPPAATAIAPSLPDAVDPVLARGLAKDPDARQPTSSSLVSELTVALGPTAKTGVAVPGGEATAVREATPPSAATPAGNAAPPRDATPLGAVVPRRPRPPREPAAPPHEPAPSRVATPPPAAAPQRNRLGRIAVAAALLLVAAAAAIAALAGGGDEGGSQQSVQSMPSVATPPEKKPAPKPEPAATTPQTTETQPSAPATDGMPADAAETQAAAHSLIEEGDYQGAVDTLKDMVQQCDVAITDPCAYAWFDIGYALRRIGEPQLAVAALERRLQNPNQSDVVQDELDAARAEAAGEQPTEFDKHGKPKKPKKHDRD